MQLPPTEVILSWPTPNYLNPKDVRGPQLLVISGIFFPIALLMVGLRIFTRLRLSKSFGVDDVFLLLAIIPAGACAVLSSLAMTRWRWNRHIWDVPIDLLSLGLKLTSTRNQTALTQQRSDTMQLPWNVYSQLQFRAQRYPY